jgi:RNA polymerase sigma-70 factor (ECF subfamily)
MSSQTADSAARQRNSEQLSDEDLIDVTAKGDIAAFDMLVQRHRTLVLAVTRRITGNVDDAEDVAQQAFMKAFTKLSTFEGRSSFSTWLVSIARNEALMSKRRDNLFRTVSILADSNEGYCAFAAQLPDVRLDPEISHARRERADLLISAMGRLNPTTRVALQLCDLEEYSIHDAAMKLGLSVPALKSRRVRGRKALRRILKGRLSKLLPTTASYQASPLQTLPQRPVASLL